MKQSLSARVLAFVCACALCVPVFAAERTHTLSEQSEAALGAKVYDYEPIRTDPAGRYKTYGNTVTVAACERVYDDAGNLYRVTDSTLFNDSSAFTRAIKTTVSPMSVERIEAAGGEIVGSGAAFVITLEDYLVDEGVTVGFTVTYTAQKDIKLPVVTTGKNAGTAETLDVRRGAKIVLNYRADITGDDLSASSYLNPLPDWYGDVVTLKDGPYAAGAEDIFLYPSKDGDSDYTWEDSDIIVAELNGGDYTYMSKLSTRRSDTGRDHTALLGEYYTRFFSNYPSVSGAILTLTNPFLTFDGNETVPHGDVHIYEVTETGDLQDVTSRFTYGADSNGRGAFIARIDKLGRYVFTAKPVVSLDDLK